MSSWPPEGHVDVRSRVDGDELPERSRCECGYLMAGADGDALSDLYVRHVGQATRQEARDFRIGEFGR